MYHGEERYPGGDPFGENRVTTPNSKVPGICHHFFRERVAYGELKIVHITSALQHSDILTKPLHTEAFRFYRKFVLNLWRFLKLVIRTFSRVLGYWVVERRKGISRELEKVLGCTHALGKVNMPIRYADGLDESCRTRWPLVNYPQPTGVSNLLASVVLSKSDAISCDLLHTLEVNIY